MCGGLGHLDLPGAGQVTVAGPLRLCRAHPEQAEPRHLDRRYRRSGKSAPGRDRHARRSDLAQPQGARRRRSDGRQPRAQSDADRPARRAVAGRAARAAATSLGATPTRAELAQKLSVTEADLAAIEAAEKQPYRNGGFRIYDVSNPAKPKLMHHQLTGGIGVHRFDMDERYAYISTEMDGFVGNILVIYDMRDPTKPRGSFALVDAGTAYRRRRKAVMVRQAPPAAPRAALRR